MNIEKSGRNYPYAWIDEVIGVILNPRKADVTELPLQALHDIEQNFPSELATVFSSLNAQTFTLRSSNEIQVVSLTYYETLRLLIQQARFNLAAYEREPLLVTGERLIMELEDLQRAMELRYGRYFLPEIKPESGGSKSLDFKVRCCLSVDQLGILLKAADDTRLITSRSLSLVFRSIVPYLSTDKTRDISWNGMRTSVYKIEHSDKEAVIDVLQKLIRKIEQY